MTMTSLHTTAAPKGRGMVAFLACAMALALNHSERVGGINLSLADPLLVLTVFALLGAKSLRVPTFVGMFFLSVIAISGITAVAWAPLIFGVEPGNEILTEVLKMTVSLLFLLCGIGVARMKLEVVVLRCFALGAAAVASIGVLAALTGLNFLPDSMYYAGFRFKGFMIDPNYWAVLSNASIAYLAGDRGMPKGLRTVFIASLVGSIILSGSKTGLITLAMVCVVLLLSRASRSNRRVEWTAVLLLATAAVVITWDQILATLDRLVSLYVIQIPQLERISILLNDPIGAISESGSGRDDTWQSGLSMIESSPILGVGIGSYRNVNGALFGDTAVAHNTYIQLIAEWGVPLALLFFGWIGLLLIRASIYSRNESVDHVVSVRNMVICFLVGSISLSLNNARMFWLFLGILLYLVSELRERARDDMHRVPAYGVNRDAAK